MANRTISGAVAIHSGDPQNLIEKIVRERIYESLYWKEQCFGLAVESIVDRVIQLDHVGGLYANQRPTPFLCLLLKLLQLQPDKEIILEFIRNKEFKYLTILGAFYWRLVASSIDIYQELEPLLLDYRKIRQRTSQGYSLTYVDEIIDKLLIEDRVYDIILPRLVKRKVLEVNENIPKRISPLLLELESDV